MERAAGLVTIALPHLTIAFSSSLLPRRWVPCKFPPSHNPTHSSSFELIAYLNLHKTSSKMSVHPQTQPLLTHLATELHMQIVSNLTFFDLLRLSMTNHYFRDLLTPEILDQAKEVIKQQMLEQEVAEHHQNRMRTLSYAPRVYRCYQCLRGKLWNAFRVPQVNAWRAEGGPRAAERSCIECEARMGIGHNTV